MIKQKDKYNQNGSQNSIFNDNNMENEKENEKENEMNTNHLSLAYKKQYNIHIIEQKDLYGNAIKHNNEGPKTLN